MLSPGRKEGGLGRAKAGDKDLNAEVSAKLLCRQFHLLGPKLKSSKELFLLRTGMGVAVKQRQGVPKPDGVHVRHDQVEAPVHHSVQ